MQQFSIRDRMEIHQQGNHTDCIVLHSTEEEFNLFLQEVEELKQMCKQLVQVKNRENRLKENIYFLEALVEEHQEEISELLRIIEEKDYQLSVTQYETDSGGSRKNQKQPWSSQQLQLLPKASFQFQENVADFYLGKVSEIVSSLSEESYSEEQKSDTEEGPLIQTGGVKEIREREGEMVQEIQVENQQLLCRITLLENKITQLQKTLEAKTAIIEALQKQQGKLQMSQAENILKTSETLPDENQNTIMDELDQLELALMSEVYTRVSLELQISQSPEKKQSQNYQEIIRVTFQKQIQQLRKELKMTYQTIETKKQTQFQYQDRMAEMQRDREALQSCLLEKERRLKEEIEKNRELKSSMNKYAKTYSINHCENEEEVQAFVF